MKIIDMRGQKYPSKYEWGKEEYWNKVLREMMNVRLITDYPKIEKIYVGDSSNPYNEIYLEDGTMLYDEFNSPIWAIEENDKVLVKFYTK